MLVLARKVNQSVMIGDNIEIVVVEVAQGKVKLGISAPHEVSVHRKEIWEEIQRENLLAQQVSPDVIQQARQVMARKDSDGHSTGRHSGGGRGRERQENPKEKDQDQEQPN